MSGCPRHWRELDRESGSVSNQYCGLYFHGIGEIQQNIGSHEESIMKVSDILRVKGNTLYTVTPDDPVAVAVQIMAEKDIGSLVVMEHGEMVGLLTFREVILTVVKNGGAVGTTQV